MTINELREEVDIEIDLIQDILQEIAALHKDLENRSPTVREKTAAAAFMAQFYAGIENILKRISRFYSVAPPDGDTWHIDLFKRFCKPASGPLPVLFDESLAADMAPYRKFRHVVFHSYGSQLEWDRMKEGIDRMDAIFERFKDKLLGYLSSLNQRN